MKQSVLDRNAWLAGSLLRQKQKGTRQQQPGNETAETWLCMKKQIFLNDLKKIKQHKEKRENLLCKHLLPNKLQLSLRCIQLLSNLLNKADLDGKCGLLFHQITSASLNAFNCLYQFTSSHCGKLFHRLAQSITNTV